MTNDARAIEQRLLELAYTTDTKLTATALAYFAPCAIEDASRVLEELAARGTLTMDVEDDGAISYTMPGRTKLGAPVLRREVASPRDVALARGPGRRRSPAAAAVLTALVPGAGHAYAGHALAAVLWFMAVGAGYALVLPGLLLHVWCMISAARATQPRLAEPRRPMLLAV
jgi:hypothetical protein